MQIQWKPDKSKSDYIQDQIIQYFKAKISSGSWPVGTRLPSERKLAEQFEVNRSTISHVLDELKARGIMASYGSKGTYVFNNTWSLMQQPDWNRHIESSLYKPNHKMIQQINKYEFQEGIIRLGTGELSPDLFPKDIMKALLIEASESVLALGYEENLGQLKLREAISQHLTTLNIKASPDQILITSGALQALHLISIGLLQFGSNVYVESPSYLKSLYTFQSAGMRLQGIPMGNEGLDVDQLRSIYKRKEGNLLYTMPTFHNPTGIVMSDENRLKLMELVNAYQIPVIEDDAYRALWLDTPPANPLKSLDPNGHIIYVGTLSKTFAPGIRVGWVTGPQTVIERLGDLKMQLDYGTSSLSQFVALKWFEHGYHELYGADLRAKLLDRRNHMVAALKRHMSPYGKWEVPTGGFYIWFVLNKKINSSVLFERALKNNILLNMGHIYDFKENHALRLSYAYASKSEIDQGIEIISRLIQAL
ncbi:aminotransferase-like domain-containing protein [Fusibacter ferrireducens]|uniref:PLP-dependent aminotransferase family protein n=1 Tax=Fusibacter ferrireducens TaxID=2785058 RepID=A0ABR9ZSU2_9FIRM|nr:PLP-dependent aminotransferase family protein [Fusibacter ferrireducens]MBF4693538.1 PLP-dependent aminotransferase family protein [Fusibacter ferrireducens]